MMNIEESRRALGEDGEKMSDEQIRKLINSLHPVIESILDKYFDDLSLLP